MPLTAEQTTIIRSGLDASGYVAGAKQIVAANQDIATSGAEVVSTQTKTTRSLVDGGSAFDRLRQKVDDNYRAAVQYAKAQDTIQRAVAAGRVDIETGNRVQSLYQQSLMKTAETSNAASYAVRDLGIQSIDFFQGIATGQPILRTFIQQGAQVGQVAAVSGVSIGQLASGVGGALASAMRFVVSPIGLAITGVTALGAATYEVLSHAYELADEQKQLATAIQAVGKTAQLSTGQLQDYITALQHAGVGRADAAGLVTGLARDPRLTQAQIGQIVNLAPNMAAGLGTDVATQAKALQGFFDDIAGSVTKLDQQLNLLTPDQLAAVEAMVRHGDAAKAAAVAVDALHGRFDGLADQVRGPMATAFHDLGNAWDDFVRRIANSAPVQAALDAIRRGAEGIAQVLKDPTIGELKNQLADLDRIIAQDRSRLDGMSNMQGLFGGGGLRFEISDSERRAQEIRQRLAVAQGGFGPYLTDLSQVPLGRAANDITGLDLGPSPADTAKSIQALASSRLAGSPIGQVKQYTDELAQFQKALTALGPKTSDNAERFDTLTAAIAADQKALEDARKALDPTHGALTQHLADLDSQIKNENALAAAYLQGSDAVQRAMAVQAAEKTLIGEHLTPSMKGYAAALKEVTDRQLEEMRASNERDVSKQIAANDDQLRYLKAETDSIGMNSDARALMLQQLKDEIDLKNKVIPLDSDYAQKLIASNQAIVAQQQTLQNATQSYQALTNIGSQAFDQLGQSISDAFLSGSGQAVNFGNVVKSVLGSVLSQLAKLAIINPLINSLFSPSQLLPTLGAALTGTSSGGGILGSLGSLFGAGSGGGGFSLGSAFNGIGNFLGLGDLFDTLPASAYTALPAGVSGPVATSSSLFGNLSAFLGPIAQIGAGFGIGSTAGSFLQGALGKTGPGPAIGAGLFALTGFLTGGPLGALIEGTIGGLLGSLFGPGKQNAYSQTHLTLNDGLLGVGATNSQLVDTSQELANLRNQVDQINSYLTSANLRISAANNSGGNLNAFGQWVQIGQNTPGGYVDPSKYADFFTPNVTGHNLFSGLGFTATDAELNAALDGRSFPDLTSLQNFVTLVQQTIPALVNFDKTTGSLADQLTALNKQYQDAIDAASSYGLATDALTAAQQRAVQVANDNAAAQVTALTTGLQGRYLTAAASISGSPSDALAASLFNFDAQAQQQRDQFKAQLTGIYGTAYTETAAYADAQAQLERTLGEERLAIQQQYNDQLTQQATGIVTNISDYVTKLSIGSASPLSPMAQYELAKTQFETVAASAAAGDYSSLTSLTTYADTLLSASRTVNGGGYGYTTDYSEVVDALKAVATKSPPDLIAAIAQGTAATQSLGDLLEDVVGRLDALTLEVRMQNLSSAVKRAA